MVFMIDAPQTGRETPDSLDGVPDRYRQGLLKRAKAGDADAFARLYDIYADRVYQYMRFHVGDEKTAEDLAACVFARAWRNIDCHEPGHPRFGAWLYLIARKTVMDFARSKPEGLVVREILSPADEGLEEYQELVSCFKE